MIRLCLGVTVLLLFAACGKSPPPPAVAVDHPALWRIEKDGRHGWLFGTVHALPPGARWESPELAAALSESDRLVVEAVGLQDQHQVRADFDEIAKTPGLPPLSARVPPASHADLAEALKQIQSSEVALSVYESWGAAVMISSSLTNGIAGIGVEQLLLKRFADQNKPIDGLETIKQQFGYLDGMKPDAQDRFLAASVHDPAGDAEKFNAMYQAWRRGDLATIARQTEEELNASPEVREPLLIARNRDWAEKMDAMLKKPGTPFIAVGSGHLVGPDNLIDMLKARGFQITRAE